MRGLLIILCLISTFVAVGQKQGVYEKYNIYRSPARVFLNRFSFTLTTGYSRTYYKNDLEGVYFYQDRNAQYILPNNETLNLPQFRGFTDWLNNPTLGDEVSVRDPFDVPFTGLSNPVLNPELANGIYFVDTDTAAIRFRGVSGGIPITLQLHYNFMEKFRVGLGYTWEKHYVSELYPTSNQSVIRVYQPNVRATRYSRLFLTGGYKFYEYYNHLFVAEIQVGRITAGPNEFNQGLISRSIYLNAGVSIEKELSEYFRVIVKPSLDIKNYKVTLPNSSTELRTGYPTLHLQVGLSINIPEIPRTPYRNDHIQLKHVITDQRTGQLREVRGQPFYRWQNPKVGQNHRKLWRYKNRNKKKLDPY